jgi:hypothetical protein
MEFIIEKEQKEHKLSGDEKRVIAKKIVDDFETYDKARSEQLEKAKKVSNEIFFRNPIPEHKEKNKKWKSRVKMFKIFMYSQILKAFIWKNTYANNNSMFDVSGENLEADNDSNKEKVMLVDCMEKMEYSKALDRIIDKSLIYGELISFNTWRKKSEEYRRPISFFEGLQKPANLVKMLKAKAKGEEFYVDERVIYNNPYTYDVNPANFVFDASQYEDFDNCPKIYKTWKTPDYIINNKFFTVPKDIAEDLKNMVKDGANDSDLSNQENINEEDVHTNGTTIEMLEHWGDLTLKDGTVLKNWYAVVVAGKYLVQFEKNPLVINPFTFGAYVLDENTKRGVSPLYAIYELAMTQEELLRRTIDLQKLQENPPNFVGKGFFGPNVKDIEVYPGKLLEYDPQIYTTIPITPMKFDSNVFQVDLQYIDDLMSEISGIFPNMAGASESERTTATEISTKVEGQLTRLKMLLDIINQNLILASIKKIAKLKSNFTFGEETVFVNNENKQENVVINDRIRQAEYRFTYADRSATSERFNYVDMVAQAVQMFVKTGLQVNKEEFFTWYMEQKGVENPERFLMGQMIPPEVQQIIMQNPIIAEMVANLQANMQQGQPLPQEGEEEVQMPTTEQQPGVGEELMSNLSNLPGRHMMNG